jgi:hypothetical protein
LPFQSTPVIVWPSRTTRGNKRSRLKQRDEKIPNRFRKNRNDDDCDGDDDSKTLNPLFFSSHLFSPPFLFPSLLSFSSPEREQPGILKVLGGRYQPGFRSDHGRQKTKKKKRKTKSLN